MKPIVQWTLRQRRWSMFWWSVATFGLIFINMIFYPSFRDQADQLRKSFENIPESTLGFIGGSTDFFSPVGFLNSQVFFLMLPLLLGVLAISLGGSLLAREEQDNTAESLLARPISRTKLLSAKAFAGTLILAVATLVGFLTTAITAAMVDLDVGFSKIALATLACYLLTLGFAAIAFMFTAIGKARIAGVGIATLVALGGYIVSSLAGTVSWMETPSKLLPFHYYQPEAILRGTYNWWNVTYLAAIILIAWIVSWLSFRKRDLG